MGTLCGSMAKVALGKGLNALISSKSPVNPVPQEGESVIKVPLNMIVPSPLQPRKEFKPESLSELVESIRERGIIQPLIVRPVNGKYELIAGERRWRASSQLQLKEAPVIVRQVSDSDVLELALIENLQREDLNAIDEAQAYARLAQEFNLKQEEIAQKVGKSRASVANAMRLLDLSPEVQAYIITGRLTVGHAKVLLSVKSHEEQKLLAETLIRQSATVRAAEKLVAQHLQQLQGTRPTRSRASSKTASLPPALENVQNRLRNHLATHVVLQHHDKKGSLEIEYYGLDDLQRILGLLKMPNED